jgi:hypothetical protein
MSLNINNFKTNSFTQELLTGIKSKVPELKFGLFKNNVLEKTNDSSVITFKQLHKNGTKQQGSITHEDNHILILSSDANHEYRAENQWHASYFLKVLIQCGFDWVKTSQYVPSIR